MYGKICLSPQATTHLMYVSPSTSKSSYFLLFRYNSSKDNTTPAQLHDIVKESVLETPYLKISFSPIVRFANLDTQQDYQNRLNYFLLMNGRRDQHADFYTTIECKNRDTFPHLLKKKLTRNETQKANCISPLHSFFLLFLIQLQNIFLPRFLRQQRA